MDDATEADYESFTNSRQESGEDFYKGSGDYSGSFSDSEASDRFQQMMENTSNTGETLQQHLESQLLESTTSPTVQNLAKLIISNLDNKGFFSIPLESLFSNIQGYEEEKKEALDLIRSFDPYGVGVSNYRESLVLQGQILGLDKEDLAIFSSLVFDYLDKLKGGKNHEVARALKISDSTVEEFYSILKSLNPYPGLQYGDDAFHYIEPDFSVHNIDGDLVLDINRHGIPSLSISQEFSSLTNEMEHVYHSKKKYLIY